MVVDENGNTYCYCTDPAKLFLGTDAAIDRYLPGLLKTRDNTATGFSYTYTPYRLLNKVERVSKPFSVVPDLLFAEENDANYILDNMKDRINRYGFVDLWQFKEICLKVGIDLTITENATSYRWYDISDARIVTDYMYDCFRLYLPEPMYVGSGLTLTYNKKEDNTMTIDFDFSDRCGAEVVLDEMMELIKEYDVVTLADCYDLIEDYCGSLCDIPKITWKMNQIGWRDLTTSDIIKSPYKPGSFRIAVPKAEPIERKHVYNSIYDGERKQNIPRYYYSLHSLPRVTDVQVYNNRVVKVTFADNTFTKSVCSENDNFDLDVGITICVTKRMFGSGSTGTRGYNNMMRDIHKTMTKNAQDAVNAAKEKSEERNRQKKLKEKRDRKNEAAKREMIDIQKQAYLEAMHEHDSRNGDDGK